MANECPLCNGKMGMFTTTNIADTNICSTCASIISAPKTICMEQFKKAWSENDSRLRLFTPTQELKGFFCPENEIIHIDHSNKMFCIGKNRKNNARNIICKFDEVKSYDIVTFGQKTITKKKGGIGRALIGGMVGGSVGALVGASTAKQETKQVGGHRFVFLNITLPYGVKNFKLSSNIIQHIDFFEQCINASNSVPTTNKNNSSEDLHVADVILKYKNLLDIGAISQEEYNKKKNELLLS